MKKQKAFTLIELLVVISIIGVLASVALVAMGKSRAKARDAKRKADLHQIATALDLYYSDNGGYPSTAWPNEDYKIPNSLALEPKMANYIAKFPADPLGGGGCYNNQYLYVSDVYGDGSSNNAKATTYALYATLEDQSSTNLSNTGLDANLRSGEGACDATRGVPNFKLGNYTRI